MKIYIPLLAMFLVGCGAHSNDNQMNPTNSTASQPPGSPGNVNSPAVGMTNAPANTNAPGTNMPAPPNQ